MSYRLIILIFLVIITIYLLKQKTKETFNNYKLDVAVIVEPRKHKYLIPVVKNIIKNLPNDVKIQIFHGTDNIEFIKNAFNKYIKSNKIKITNLHKKNLSIKDYNYLLSNKTFWNQIDGENILIFQTDSCLCSKNKSKLKDILKYDYVGAPWKDPNYSKGGNGGLSFRKKSAMLNICNKFKNSKPRNEDMFFSSKNLYFPDKKFAQNIFVETIYDKNPLGIHKAWRYLNKNQFKKLKLDCPEINEIFGK